MSTDAVLRLLEVTILPEAHPMGRQHCQVASLAAMHRS